LAISFFGSIAYMLVAHGFSGPKPWSTYRRGHLSRTATSDVRLCFGHHGLTASRTDEKRVFTDEKSSNFNPRKSLCFKSTILVFVTISNGESVDVSGCARGELSRIVGPTRILDPMKAICGYLPTGFYSRQVMIPGVAVRGHCQVFVDAILARL